MSRDPNPEVWMVSACLLGHNCRYNAEVLPDIPQRLLPVLQDKKVVPICPEQAGGLPTPRPAAVLSGGDGQAVLDGQARVVQKESGVDVTEAFVKGAKEAVKIARACGATHALLKARSPSCGLDHVHFKDGLKKGRGVSAAALLSIGLEVKTEEGALKKNKVYSNLLEGPTDGKSKRRFKIFIEVGICYIDHNILEA